MAILNQTLLRATSLALLVKLWCGCAGGNVEGASGAIDGTPRPPALDGSADVAAPAPDGAASENMDGALPWDVFGGSDGYGGVGEHDAPKGDAATCGHCAAYSEATPIGPVSAALPELSGLAASRRHPGRLYAHNDSGDVARIFVLAAGGLMTTELDLEGATTVDWEDIAVGPCGAISCIFVGDIGDNKLARAEYAIYRLIEPEDPLAGQRTPIATYQRFAFVYPDGPHNAETLLVHPTSGRVFVVTKSNDAPQLFEVPTPLEDGRVAVATPSALLAHLPAMPVTGGSFHPCGDRVLLRTYTALLEYVSAPGREAEAPFGDEPSAVPVATELQGESVTYQADGLGYVTGSETPAGTPAAVLSSVTCR